ncbi:hypothetical protein pb186bvf_002189 [Paramecium bursaria]
MQNQSQTQTITEQPIIVILQNHQEAQPIQPKIKKQKNKGRVQWTEDTVDNEDLNRLKSNICCIYKKPRSEQSSSSDTCSSDDEVNAIERDRISKQKHHQKCSKKKCC